MVKILSPWVTKSTININIQIKSWHNKHFNLIIVVNRFKRNLFDLIHQQLLFRKSPNPLTQNTFHWPIPFCSYSTWGKETKSFWNRAHIFLLIFMWAVKSILSLHVYQLDVKKNDQNFVISFKQHNGTVRNSIVANCLGLTGILYWDRNSWDVNKWPSLLNN